jgi:integral membrane protein
MSAPVPNAAALRELRFAALCEGVSLTVLLFVAMPLKYAAGLPLAVRIVGAIHGLLFLVMCAALYRVVLERRWPLGRWLAAFVWSLVPFGFLVLDRNLRAELAAEER